MDKDNQCSPCGDSKAVRLSELLPKGDDELTIGRALVLAFNKNNDLHHARCGCECEHSVHPIYSDRASRLCEIGEVIETIEALRDSEEFAEKCMRAFDHMAKVDQLINELDKYSAELLYYVTPEENKNE